MGTARTPTAADQAKAALDSAFPLQAAIRDTHDTVMARQHAVTDTGAAGVGTKVGLALLGLPAIAGNYLDRTVVQPGKGLGGFARGVASGLFGNTSPASEVATPTPPVDPRAAAMALRAQPGFDPVAQALRQGAQASDVPVAPTTAIGQFVSNLLAHGASVGQLASLAPAISSAPALAKQGQSARDKNAGIAGDATDTVYKSELAAAQGLPEGAKRDAAVLKATDKYRQNYAALAGVNLQALGMQQMLDQQNGQ